MPVIHGVLLLAGLAAFTAAALGAGRILTARTIRRIDCMLQAAIDGTFLESSFDETRLSALEARMVRYLSENAVTAQGLAAEKDKIKALISDISHQTKTPLANILLYAQLLSEQELPDSCRLYTDALSAQTEKLQFLIEALVKTSRLESGVICVRPERRAVRALLDAAAAPIAPKAARKGMQIRLPDTDAEAQFDLKWTAEAIGNLLDNAVKYAPEGTEILVTVQPYELFCRIDVTDCGMGIREGESEKIFQRFYRAPEAAGQEGIGIGLFLTREILTVQGGYIKVRSEPAGGSTFSVFLPSAS